MPSLKAERRIRPGSSEGLAAELGWLPTGCAPPRQPGPGSRRRRALRCRRPRGLRRSCPPLSGSERTPTPTPRRRRRRVPAPARSEPHPAGLLPPAPARPGERGGGAPSPPRRGAGTPELPRPPARPRVRRAPGNGGGGAAPIATPAPVAPRPAPGPLGSRRAVPAASGGARRPGRSRLRAARKLARSRRDLDAV